MLYIKNDKLHERNKDKENKHPRRPNRIIRHPSIPRELIQIDAKINKFKTRNINNKIQRSTLKTNNRKNNVNLHEKT